LEWRAVVANDRSIVFICIMKKVNWKLRIGIILIIISFPPFLFLPVIPFLHVASSTKITITTICLVSGEVLFWSGGLLVGKELFTRYKAWLNPRNWFRRKPGEGQSENL
jgi:hypothetical protein